MDPQTVKRYAFIGEWYQEEAGIERIFYIYYFPKAKAIELFDVKTKKTFLRRTKIAELNKNDFFIGAKLNIFGRQIEIVDYGNARTREMLSRARETSILILKGNIIHRTGQIITALNENGFILNNGRMVKFTSESIRALLSDNDKDKGITFIINQLIGQPCIIIEIVAENVIERIKSYLNPDDTKKPEPNSLQLLCEEEDIKNGIICSKSYEDAKKSSEIFFNPKSEISTTVMLKNSTLAIIKPHAIKERKAGAIISDLYNNGFRITGFKIVSLEKINCEEFYEVYKGVLSEYIQMVAQLASGICIVLELQIAEDESGNAHEKYRKLCGPIDPEIGRQLRPYSLRAKYGKDKIMNALHCTDLPEDNLLELEYFFKIIE